MADTTLDVDAAGATPWAAELVEGMTGARDPSLTADLLEIFVMIDGDLFVATRQSVQSEFTGLVRLDGLSSLTPETSPEISANGLTLVFASARDGGDMDLYISYRADRN